MTLNKENLSFGKRYGYEPVDTLFQVEDMNDVLRIELWNAFLLFIIQPFNNADRYSEERYSTFHKIIWIHYFKKAYDDFSNDSYFTAMVKHHIKSALWYKVYEFFEFVFQRLDEDGPYEHQKFIEYISVTLEQNNSGYTIINNRFTPVTNTEEIEEIKSVQKNAQNYSLTGIQEHLTSSIELLSKKPAPDYRNSIKESISMVEVISRIIEPSENTLGKALNKLEKGQKLPKTLIAGFEKLYAYTNSKNGIRHALMEEKIISLEEARFFLIACSAFTNYLIEKARKESLLK